MGASAAVHPSSQTLQDYGLGKLDEPNAEPVKRHLESCPECQRQVAELSSDSFLDRMRGARGELDTGPVTAASLAGLSRIDRKPSSVEPPPAGSLPRGLADHPDYEVIRELGQGGMGTVYLAQNRLMGRNEVLKVVSGHLIKRRGVLDRFLVEIRNAARLHHTNIVTAYSASRLEDSFIFAMEYVEGLDLSQLVKAKGPLPVANACRYVNQACLGLQHAHEHGMVHRDIKPSNLMLTRQGERAVIKVLDFGLAKIQSEGPVDAGLTHEGQMLGTPDYIAPEQIRDARGSDIRADVYSMGCTLYYLLTGGPPFQATSLYDLLQAHHSMDAMPLNLVRPEVPVELAAIVAKMMAKEPGRRFQTPKDVAQALTPFFKKGDVAASGKKPELSRAGDRAVEGGAVKSRSRKAAEPTRPGAIPAGLIDLGDREPLFDTQLDAAPAGPSRKPAGQPRTRSRPPWIWPAVAVGLLILGFFAAWMSGVLKVKTPDGVIVLENVPVGAEIVVDGNRITFTWPGIGKAIEVRAVPGQHQVEVKKNGVTLTGELVTVTTADSTKATIRLERLDDVHTETKQTEPSVAKATPKPEPTTEAGEKPEPKAEVTATRPTPAQLAKLRTPSENSVSKGTWTIDGDELGQSDDQILTSVIFGDPAWSEYDLALEAKRISGRGHGLHVLFHRTDGLVCRYGLGVFDNSGSEICFFRHGQASREGEVNKDNWNWSSINQGRWYSIKVKVRKSRFECYLNDKLQFKDSDASLTHGRIGLGTERIQAAFRNIKVTDPQGNLLFEGLPDVGSTSVAGGVRGEKPIARKPAAPFKKIGSISLFDGKDTSGWKQEMVQNGSTWQVVDGLLEGRAAGLGNPAVLVLQRQDLADFRLIAKVRYSRNGGHIEVRRSGVPKRYSAYAVGSGVWPGSAVPVGSVTKVTDVEYGKGFGWDLRASRIPCPADTWNTIEIIVSGDRIVSKLNGKTRAEYIDAKDVYWSGGLALICGGPGLVQYESIILDDVPPAAAN